MEWHPLLSVGEAMGPYSTHMVASIPFLVSMGRLPSYPWEKPRDLMSKTSLEWFFLEPLLI